MDTRNGGRCPRRGRGSKRPFQRSISNRKMLIIILWKLTDNKIACTLCPSFEKEACIKDIKQKKMLTVVISSGRTSGDFYFLLSAILHISKIWPSKPITFTI